MKDFIVMGVGQNIKELRKTKGWSQQELAKRINTHVSHVNRIEKERAQPSCDSLISISKALEVTIDALVNGEPQADVRIENESLSERIRLLNTMNDDERNVVIKVIDAMLTKKRVLEAVSSERA